jgi:hypothetical protein
MAGSTTPSPVAYIVIESPAKMGFEGPTTTPDFRTRKTPGSCASKTTGIAALEALPFLTTRSMLLTSGISKGTWTLIWSGDTYSKGAAMPAKNTCVPLSSLGSGRALAVIGAYARLVP